MLAQSHFNPQTCCCTRYPGIVLRKETAGIRSLELAADAVVAVVVAVAVAVVAVVAVTVAQLGPEPDQGPP